MTEPILNPRDVAQALIQFRKTDAVLTDLIERVGPFRMKRTTNRFQSLLRAIVAQQISTAAARSIWTRIVTLAGTDSFGAQRVHELTDDELRGAGLSPQKIRYLRDLTEKVRLGDLRLASLHRCTDEDVIAELTAVKGIGIWTAQMFLMFSLGRRDVLPYGDLGIQAAMKKLYRLSALPAKDECHRIAEPWRPYSTVACWYLWRSLELRDE